ncbi:GNAT family N-acetyltransferase [Pseudooceanicola sp. LIPI14-2-Ac024]|uniref:GNAT family N-acetyltransferase n=1 Tax=Pseudooceanicola sp. LIPI14-2-Ac024 TaxID=3344875 RepID=UPI0035CF74D1
MTLPAPFRRAVPADAPEAARLKNIAGLGLTLHIWQGVAPDDPWGHGAALMAKAIRAGEVVVAGETGSIRGQLHSYRVPDTPVPLDTLPALYRGIVPLRDSLPGHWYIDDIATTPEARGQGLGTRMLALAEAQARDAGAPGVCLIVADTNTGARRLYDRAGYAEADSAAFDPLGWDTPTRRFILMRKPLAA